MGGARLGGGVGGRPRARSEARAGAGGASTRGAGSVGMGRNGMTSTSRRLSCAASARVRRVTGGVRGSSGLRRAGRPGMGARAGSKARGRRLHARGGGGGRLHARTRARGREAPQCAGREARRWG
jgi:hypothetical protein